MPSLIVRAGWVTGGRVDQFVETPRSPKWSPGGCGSPTTSTVRCCLPPWPAVPPNVPRVGARSGGCKPDRALALDESRREGLDNRQTIRHGVVGGVPLALVVSAGAWSSVGLDRLGVSGSVALAAVARSAGCCGPFRRTMANGRTGRRGEFNPRRHGEWRQAARGGVVGPITLLVGVRFGHAAVAGFAGRRGGRRAAGGGWSACPDRGGGAAVSWTRGSPVAPSGVGWLDPRVGLAANDRLARRHRDHRHRHLSTRATASPVVSASVLLGGQVSWTLLRRNFAV